MATYRIWTFVLAAGLALSGLGCPADSSGQVTKSGKEKKTMTTVNKINTPDISEAAPRDVGFECKISAGEDAIEVHYSVTNRSDKDIYVLDAYPGVDENRNGIADLAAFFLSFREPASATVLKGVPPPPSMSVARRVMPLGTKLEPNATLRRELKLPLPLRERSDWYYPPLPPEQYAIGSIDRIVMHVQFIRSTAPEFSTAAAHYAPEFFIVNATEFVKHVETLKKEFSVDKTTLLLRKDRFPRF